MGKFGFSKVNRADWDFFEEKPNPGVGNFGVCQGQQRRLGCFLRKIKHWNGKIWDLLGSTEQIEAFPRKNTILRWEILGSPEQTGEIQKKNQILGWEILGFVGVDRANSGFSKEKPNSRQVGVSGGHEDPLLVRPPLSIGHHLLDGSAHQAGATCHQDALGHLRHGQNPAGRGRRDELRSPWDGRWTTLVWAPTSITHIPGRWDQVFWGKISAFLAKRGVAKGACLAVTGLKLSWRPPGPDLPRGTARPLEREGHLHPQVCAQISFCTPKSPPIPQIPPCTSGLHMRSTPEPESCVCTPNLPLHPRSPSVSQISLCTPGLHPRSPPNPKFPPPPQVLCFQPKAPLHPKSQVCTRDCIPRLPCPSNSSTAP